uniref:Uncharacterized protein n=1 Tax=viral metagenome TaxID=1070528 RepID=A0A6C0E806_9ZZZZ
MQPPEVIFFTIIYITALIFAIPPTIIGDYLTLNSTNQTKINKLNKMLRHMIMAIPLTLVLIIFFQYRQTKLGGFMIHRCLITLLVIYMVTIMIYIALIPPSSVNVPDPKNPPKSKLKLKLNTSFYILISPLLIIFIGGVLDFLFSYYDENLLVSGFLNE